MAVRRRARSTARAGYLRALRPYDRHQGQLRGELVRRVDEQEREIRQLHADLGRRADRLDRLEVFVSDSVAALEALRQRTITAERSAASADERSGRMVSAIDELRALPYMAGEPVTSLQEQGLGSVIGFRLGDRGPEREGYVAFEDVFRGPAERVQAAQAHYVPLFHEHEPVLDVGCGRGEFLALLKQAGIAARGVDSDEGMVRACRGRGLSDVVQADANTYLEGVDPSSVGAIFSAQVIEHMPYRSWRRFLSLALEKLKPGGHVIFETVNPHRLASLKTFWIDPTHCQPIFPEVALVECAIIGFPCAYAFAPGGRDFERERFTAPAYAVLARKDAPA